MEKHTDAVNAISISDTLKFAFSGSSDKSVKVWHLETQLLVCTLIGHTAAVRCLQLLPNSIYCIASGSDDCSIKIWNCITGQEIVTLSGHTKPVIQLYT